MWPSGATDIALRVALPSSAFWMFGAYCLIRSSSGTAMPCLPSFCTSGLVNPSTHGISMNRSG